MGHGLAAAATMGRLRTAVRTLSALDMAPDELLRRISELGDDLAQSESEGWMATAVYAVYDPSTRRCAIAQAGHPPPVLVEPGRTRGGAPRGCSTTCRRACRWASAACRFETTELDVPDGAVLVLYTDGLVESRRHDIGSGLERLRSTMCRPLESLEDACDDVLAAMEPGREPDDVALLMARLGTLPSGSTTSWTFPAEASAVRLARRRVRDVLAELGTGRADRRDGAAGQRTGHQLPAVCARPDRGPDGPRCIAAGRGSDPLPDPPRERVATEEDEGGRGLQLVAGASAAGGPGTGRWARPYGSNWHCRDGCGDRPGDGRHGTSVVITEMVRRACAGYSEETRAKGATDVFRGRRQCPTS